MVAYTSEHVASGCDRHLHGGKKLCFELNFDIMLPAHQLNPVFPLQVQQAGQVLGGIALGTVFVGAAALLLGALVGEKENRNKEWRQWLPP